MTPHATLHDVLARLEPLQQRAVQLVYFEGCTPSDAARILAVERAVVGNALAVTFGRVARWLEEPVTRDLIPFDRARQLPVRRLDDPPTPIQQDRRAAGPAAGQDALLASEPA